MEDTNKKYMLLILFLLIATFVLLYSTVFSTKPNPGNGGPENGNNEDLDLDGQEFFAVPEYPFGTILALVICLAAFGAYSASRQFGSSNSLPLFKSRI